MLSLFVYVVFQIYLQFPNECCSDCKEPQAHTQAPELLEERRLRWGMGDRKGMRKRIVKSGTLRLKSHLIGLRYEPKQAKNEDLF